MNDTLPVDTAEEFTVRAVPLLKEYLDKLSRVRRQIRRIHYRVDAVDQKEQSDKKPDLPARRILRAEIESIERYLARIRPAVQRFGQQVSGMIDQGRVSQLTKAELQMRLAELESVLDDLPRLLAVYRE